jgi:hypothetical protein
MSARTPRIIIGVAVAAIAAISIASVAVAATGDDAAPAEEPAVDLTCPDGQMLVQESMAYAGEAPGYETVDEAFTAYAADSQAVINPAADVESISSDQAVATDAQDEVLLEIETTDAGGVLVEGATYCSPVADEAVSEGGA